MQDDITDIAAFYDNAPDAEHRRLGEHQLEYDLTWRYLGKYLPDAGTILEIGAATGRYTLELARSGYKVTAVDLSATLINKCRRNIAEAGLETLVRFAVADARDLSDIKENGFDVVLLMGPLYHLVEESDRKRALKQAADRLRPGGILFSAFTSRFGVLADLIKGKPDWIEAQAHVRSLQENGTRPDTAPRGGFRGYFADPREIAPLHEEMGFVTLVLAGIEPVIAADDAAYNKLQGEQRELWLDLLFEISTESSIVGASRHLLYIGRR